MPRDDDDPLTAQLRSWGFAQVNRYERRAANDCDAATDHPIARAREFAPMTPERAAKRLADRDGGDRRRMLAANSGVKGLRIVQTWAVDPIPCTEDRQAGSNQAGAAVAQATPAHLEWIDRAVSRLARENLIRALCLRQEFCGVGTQSAKAATVAREYGGKLSVWQYRRELQRALDWLRGKQAA